VLSRYNPNGIASHSPRLLYSATLGLSGSRLAPTPTGLLPTTDSAWRPDDPG